MKIFFWLLLICLHISCVVFADSEDGISHGPHDELVITGANCAELYKQQDALCKWKQSLDPSFNLSTASLGVCQTGSNHQATLKILSCLPEFTQKYTDKKMHHDGPNCWGTAMSFHGNSIKPRFVWPEEISYWMESPMCRKLSVGEAKLPGDVINIYYPEFIGNRVENPATDVGISFWNALYPNRYTPLRSTDEDTYTGYRALLHTVTYLTEDLAYAKNSPGFDDLFYFHSLKYAYGRPRASECQELQNIDLHLREYQKSPEQIKGTHCDYVSVAYRCEDIAKHFNQQSLSSEDRMIWRQINEMKLIQESLFPYVFNLNLLNDLELKRMSSLSDQAALSSLTELKQPGLDKTREMLLSHKYFTAKGILKTLEQLHTRH